ncbi:preprotein translocase subunit SecG [Paludisphaera soli]|uniref:preprotein translocase subunit SecG n=1 Tax=Paludisphaera soli TaxID=2712865 RepID=UPI0013EB3908|nr:preprotein translocase subunit SecG [Paludisphaera soli]
MAVLTAIFNTLLVLLSLFLICLVLIQRGKGGGLAGAFGGAGGSSAFGTKAGDTFTRITIVAASIWILMTMLLVILTNNQQGSSIFDDAPSSLTRDLTPKSDVPPAPSPVDGAAAPAAGSAPAPAPAPAPNIPSIPDTSNFPLTPGNDPPPTPK